MTDRIDSEYYFTVDESKLIEKTESSLTHGIVSENCVTTDQKSLAKI